MPTYYSVRSEHALELRRGGYGKIVDPVLGAQDTVFKPMKVKFTALQTPIPVYGLPSKGGVARGILTPQDGALQIRKAASELGPIADSLPETDEALADWLIQTLRKHSANGSEFMEVLDSDEFTEGTPMDENLPRATLTTPVGLIVRQENGRAFCKVCQRGMGAQGVNGHVRSKKHLAALTHYDEQVRASAATG